MSSLGVLDRIAGVVNTFLANASPAKRYGNYGPSSGPGQPDRPRIRFYSDKSMITAIYTRIAIDVSGVEFMHVELDEKGRYKRQLQTPLNDALTFEPNLDQGPRSFRQDLVTTLFDSGSCVIVPVDTTRTPTGDLIDIYSLRVGNILDFYPAHIRVSLYNEATARREELVLEKRNVAIVYNPLYAVMNEPSGTYQRLARKLSLLDSIDEITASGKLDILIKLPYVVRSESKKAQAEQRRTELEMQLKNSTYGIAYVDGTEDVVQLNRPAENNLIAQIDRLTEELYAHLGITKGVMDGTADEATMLNYYNRTIEPLADATVQGLRRAFVRSKRQTESIRYFRDPFKFVPLSAIAEIGDKLIRNKVLVPNELRDKIGFPPSDDPSADQLVNPNMSADKQGAPTATTDSNQPPDQEGQNGRQPG